MEIEPARDDQHQYLNVFDRPTLIRTDLDATEQGWILRPVEPKKKKQVNLGCVIVSRKVFLWSVGAILVAGVVAGVIATIIMTLPHHHPHLPPTDNYTVALRKALIFFNEQKSGKLPKNNNVSWRGDSCLTDGEPNTTYKDLTGGYYDAGDTIKFHFPQSFAMTMLSWSVIEYNAKYEAAGELNHVKEIIKWGTDYFLKTFDSTSDSISEIASQVGLGDTTQGTPNDHYCWMRPEDITFNRVVTSLSICSDLGAEMAASLAAASIVFKDQNSYSQKLVHGATILFDFAWTQRGRYSVSGDARLFYNSTSFWDEYIWGAAWMYYATGNSSYLELATTKMLAEHAGAFSRGPDYGVLSWDNKLPGAQVLLTRLWLFLSPVYPPEEILRAYQDQTNTIMCSYLPYFKSFNRTKGGLIQLNHGRPQPLQYVVNAAFLASLYADYLNASGLHGVNCGAGFYSTDELRKFARKQVQYIMGDNPRNMSYIVGFGNQYPQHVHHRGASIPKDSIKYSCKGGYKWRDSSKPNPNILEGAMVAGPDKNDDFRDVRTDYNYTEPTIAGNAGLVAALVALSGDGSIGFDKNGIFSAAGL